MLGALNPKPMLGTQSSSAREKEVKRQTLLELVDYVNTGTGKFTEVVAEDVVFMLSVPSCPQASPPPARIHVNARSGCHGLWARACTRPTPLGADGARETLEAPTCSGTTTTNRAVTPPL